MKPNSGRQSRQMVRNSPDESLCPLINIPEVWAFEAHEPKTTLFSLSRLEVAFLSLEN